MPAIAPPLAIPPEDLHTLGQWSRSGSIRAALAERAKILLLAAEGTSNTEIAQPGRLLTPDRHLVAAPLHPRPAWTGCCDRPRSGRPQTVRARPPRRDPGHHPVAATRAPWGHPLVDRGCWPTSSGVSHNTVARVWAEHDLKPWRTETFKFSTDPQLEAKVRDVVGLYLDPPERAIVVCVDEKSPDPGAFPHRPQPAAAPGQPRAAHPRLCAARDDHPVRGVGGGHRPVTDQCFDRAPPRRVPRLPQAGGQGLPAAAAARGAGQLRHPHPRRGQGLAGQASTGPPALHPDLGELDEPGRGVLCDHHPPGDPAGQLPQRSRPDRCHPPLRRWLERALPPVCVGQRRRRHHDQGDP